MSRDDLESHIREQMKDGIEVTAEDFEGRDCDHCEETISFADWPENVVTWDLAVVDPDASEPDRLFHRYYYCSEDCKAAEQLDPTHATEPDVIREEDIDDDTLVADGGQPADRSTAISDSERSPFDAYPLTADQYHEMLADSDQLVLRVSDGQTRTGTYRFWEENGQLYWRALSWTAPQEAMMTDLSAALDDDSFTQLLTEENDA